MASIISSNLQIQWHLSLKYMGDICKDFSPNGYNSGFDTDCKTTIITEISLYYLERKYFFYNPSNIPGVDGFMEAM